MRLEGLSKLKKKNNDLIGNRIRDLPSCSIVPQRTTLPHTCICNKLQPRPVRYAELQRMHLNCIYRFLFVVYISRGCCMSAYYVRAMQLHAVTLVMSYLTHYAKI
jgi:hypothetical protein